MKRPQKILISWKEFVFQILLHVLVFIFYSFDRSQPGVEEYQVAFFVNYAAAVAIINYVLLPRLFYTKKYLLFAASVIVLIGLVMLVEEQVLEKIFFPNTRRAARFPGVFVTLFDILPVIAILSGFKFAWDAIGKQRQVEELQATVQESELQFLKSQINPHFLFNNLNNLYSYSIAQSPKTPEIILDLSAVLRYMLYECKERYVPLSAEIEQLKNFTKLYQLQIEDRGKVSFQAKNIGSSHRIAPLILVVFIENAFKHSQAAQSNDIYIRIEIELIDNTLHFICKNNFQATDEKGTEDMGIGLENVRKRLNLIYGNAHRLMMEQTEDIYTVHLTMELQKLSAT